MPPPVILLLTKLTIIQTGCNLPDYIHLNGTGTISATAIKCNMENTLPLRKDDSGVCNGQFVHSKSGSILNCSCRIYFSNAGQVKTDCE